VARDYGEGYRCGQGVKNAGTALPRLVCGNKFAAAASRPASEPASNKEIDL
jgi:hypothetical protein